MDKIDVVYILRNNGTRWMDNEIKYSIRALEQNFRFGKSFGSSEDARSLSIGTKSGTSKQRIRSATS